MALPFLIGFATLADPGTELGPKLVAYTHTCGFTRAWQDPTNPHIVWLIPECPVDAVIASLKTNISNWVNSRYNYQKNDDPHYRILAIISAVKEDAVTWLNQNTTPVIAAFLSDPERLQTWIVDELKTTGAVA